MKRFLFLALLGFMACTPQDEQPTPELEPMPAATPVPKKKLWKVKPAPAKPTAAPYGSYP
jgi:hypothetical protein